MQGRGVLALGLGVAVLLAGALALLATHHGWVLGWLAAAAAVYGGVWYSTWRHPWRTCHHCGGGKGHRGAVATWAHGRCRWCSGHVRYPRWKVKLTQPARARYMLSTNSDPRGLG